MHGDDYETQRARDCSVSGGACEPVVDLLGYPAGMTRATARRAPAGLKAL